MYVCNWWWWKCSHGPGQLFHLVIVSDFSSQITVYLGKRDFVDHVGEVDPIGELGRERERGEEGYERERG